MVQLSRLYIIAIALAIGTFVSKVFFLLFNMLPMFVIAFISKEQASFNFMATVTVHSDFQTQENKIYHCFILFSLNGDELELHYYTAILGILELSNVIFKFCMSCM